MKTPILTVDAVLINKDGKIVLIKRKYPPFEGLFALPGGHVDIGETVEQALIREVKEETGLTVTGYRLSKVWSEPSRDPRGHYVSIAYFCFCDGEPIASSDAKEVKSFVFNEIPHLAFDHNKILGYALGLSDVFEG